MKNRIVIDVETNMGATDGDLTDVWCIGIYYFENPNKPYDNYFQSDHWADESATLDFAEYLQEIVDKYVVVFHNALFDRWVLETYFGVFVREFECTLLMSYLDFPGRPEGHSLASWGVRLGYEKQDWDDFTQFSKGMSEYCERDCRLTAKVYEELKDNIPSIYSIEKQYLKPLTQLNHNGVYIDTVKFDEVIGQVQVEADKLLEEIHKIVPLVPGKLTKTKNPRKNLLNWEDRDEWFEGGYLDDGKHGFQEESLWHSYKVCHFNPGSADQVAWALHTLYGWEPERFSDKTGKPTADKSVLEECEYPLADLLLQYSEVNKLCTTYGESLKEKVRKDGRLHADFNHCITRTGRLSSSNPNLQNIPANGERGSQIRSLFSAPPESGRVLVGIDIDQFQMRILGWYLAMMLPDMEDAWSLWLDFNLNPEADPHGVTAKLMFGEGYSKDQRKVAKTCNFGVLFGIGAAKMARSLGISKDKSEYYLGILQAGFPSLGLLKAMIIEQAKQNGGDAYTLYGRRGRYPELLSSDKQERAHAERQVFNFVIQGTEADIVKMIQIQADRLLHDDTLFIIQAHDELLFECSVERSYGTVQVLEGVVNSYDWLPGLKVTGSAKVGNNWAEIH